MKNPFLNQSSEQIYDYIFSINQAMFKALNVQDDEKILQFIQQGAPFSITALHFLYQIPCEPLFKLRKEQEFEAVFRPFWDWLNQHPEAYIPAYIKGHSFNFMKTTFWEVVSYDMLEFYYSEHLERFKAAESVHLFSALEGAIQNPDPRVLTFFLNNKDIHSIFLNSLEPKKDYYNFLYQLCHFQDSIFNTLLNKTDSIYINETAKTEILKSFIYSYNKNKKLSCENLFSHIEALFHKAGFIQLENKEATEAFFVKEFSNILSHYSEIDALEKKNMLHFLPHYIKQIILKKNEIVTEDFIKNIDLPQDMKNSLLLFYRLENKLEDDAGFKAKYKI